MSETDRIPDSGRDGALVVTAKRPVGVITRIYRLLAHVKLAMALLIAILICCVVGATIFRGQQAGELIFSTLWFNGLLVLLIVNVACCFFGRIRAGSLRLFPAGMILFHLSFVSMFVGIIYNSLFHFNGTIRLTEGETLPSDQPRSYDFVDHGRYFLSAKEVRYWAGISVRYDPGLPIVLTSLWVGLGGMIITTAGRMRKKIGDGKESADI